MLFQSVICHKLKPGNSISDLPPTPEMGEDIGHPLPQKKEKS